MTTILEKSRPLFHLVLLSFQYQLQFETGAAYWLVLTKPRSYGGRRDNHFMFEYVYRRNFKSNLKFLLPMDYRTAYGDSRLDGWIYEEVMDLGVTKSYYIYSDFRSVIKGHFRNKLLVTGVESRIIGYRWVQRNSSFFTQNDWTLALCFSD